MASDSERKKVSQENPNCLTVCCVVMRVNRILRKGGLECHSLGISPLRINGNSCLRLLAELVGEPQPRFKWLIIGLQQLIEN